MASAKHKLPSDSFAERYRYSDSLHSRTDQYKVVDFHLFERQHVKIYLLIDLLKFDYRKVSLNENFTIYYDNSSCEICMKSDAANIIKGHKLKNKGLSTDYVTCQCKLQFESLDKINYFDDIITQFNCVNKIVCRGKPHYFVDAYFSEVKIMLSA